MLQGLEEAVHIALPGTLSVTIHRNPVPVQGLIKMVRLEFPRDAQ